MSIAKHRRTGFTLIELLVAAALSILIMAIMATAFQTGLGTLSTLKSLGTIAESSKTTETMLRADLEAEHFTTGAGDDSPAPMRVSDVRYDLLGAGPTGGYFQIFQGAGSLVEGFDADSMISSRAGAGENHRISMTVRRKGKTPDQLFSADLSQLNNLAPPNDDQARVSAQCSTDVGVGTRLVGQWAQVDWFLDSTRPSLIDGVNTWPLMRRVRVLGTSPTPLTTPIATSADVLSVTPGNVLNTMQTVALPGNRNPFAGTPIGAITNTAKVGDDIVMTNVLSFEVRPLYALPANPPALAFPANPDGVFNDLPGGFPAQFDTGSGAVLNNRIRVIGLQVKIRVLDTKNKLTRQTTIVVRM